MVIMRKRNDVDDDGEVRDGESVRCPMYLMDSQRQVVARFAFDADAHRPHHAELTDELRKLRAKTRAEYLAGLQDAWRTPHGDAAEPDNSSPAAVMRRHLAEPDEPDADVQARRDAIWNDYKTRLGNAWKTDPRAASAIEQQGERWRGGR
jgi:hypothetical protein